MFLSIFYFMQVQESKVYTQIKMGIIHCMNYFNDLMNV
jgi:hypothetical protein